MAIPAKSAADQVSRIAGVLGHLDSAQQPSDLDLPGYRLHPLKGKLTGLWSVTISGNWRVVFRFSDGDDVDLVGLPLGWESHAHEKLAASGPH